MSVVTTGAAYGQTPPPCERAVLTLSEAADLLRIDADELGRLAENDELPARRLGSHWRFSCAAVMAWLAHDSSSSLTSKELAAVSATGTAGAQAQTPPPASAPPEAAGQDKPVGEAPEERPAEDIFLRGQRVLLGRGEVVVDFGQFFSRNDDHLLVSVDSGVGLATIEQQTFTTLLVGRVGIFSETELFASAAFHSQRYHQFLGSTNLGSGRQNELGGMQIGVRRTVLREGPGRPDIVATVSGQIPTGDMPYAAGAGVVVVKSIDPVALFASGSYFRVFSRDSSPVARSWPEDSIDVSAGYGLALNDTLALSMAVSGVFTGNRTLDHATLRQPDVFVGRFGLTSWLAEGLYIEPSVSFGLTGPGRGFSFGVTMPYAF
jgi:excisionase family DNA binding protein